MTDQRTLTVLRKLIVDTVNADPNLPFGHLDDEVAERVAAAVLAQFEGLDPAEVTTEWGVRWVTTGEVGHAEIVEIEIHDDDRGTAEVAARATGGEVVRREVRTRYGPWTEVAR